MPSTMPIRLKTGRENALYSVYKYLSDRLNEVSYPKPYLKPNVYPLGYEQAIKFPCVTFKDLGAPSISASSMGRYWGAGFSAQEERTILEINVVDQNRPSDVTILVQNQQIPLVDNQGHNFIVDTGLVGAEAQVRRTTELIRYALTMPGMVNVPGYGQEDRMIPAIKLLDHQDKDSETGSMVWLATNEAGSFNVNFFEDWNDMPQIKRYRILARIHWMWIEGNEVF